jgi:hypothetical protein
MFVGNYLSEFVTTFSKDFRNPERQLKSVSVFLN